MIGTLTHKMGAKTRGIFDKIPTKKFALILIFEFSGYIIIKKRLSRQKWT